jgi:hypothetical protein
MMALEEKLNLTKNYEISFSMTTSDVPWEPILPYNHITPIWEGAQSGACLS